MTKHKFLKPFEFTITPSENLPDSFFERLIEFYARQTQGELKLSFIWENVLDKFHKRLDVALKAKNVPEVKFLLDHLYDDFTVFRIDIARFGPTNPIVEKYGDMVIATANALGVLRLCSPIQNEGESLNLETLITSMENVIGCKLTQKGGGNMPGIKCGDRFISYKLLESLCVWASMKRLFFEGNIWKVLEAGPGTGTLGVLINEVSSISTYHTIDLPTTSVIQAYLLALQFTPDLIWLAGEGESLKNKIYIHGILPSEKLDDSKFDIAINKDSFPEMPPDIIKGYLDFIANNLFIRGVFLSVNQETCQSGQSRVFEIMQSIQGMSLLYRCPFWAREGYVEEAWRKT